ncbi:MAG: hypothetical protein D3926_01775 [Desulfobacteraceae bacterium]|nr:MAG: hypothetical protein D3926_01775 [Desulfobacteraceae bacterium]
MELIKGIKYNFQGLLLGLKTPKLLVLGILRFVIVLILTLLVSGLIIYWHQEILSSIWSMPENKWLFYLWKVVSWLLSIILASVAAVLAYLAAQLLFCVFIMDYMSRITEKMITGQVVSSPASFGAFLWYLIKQEIPRAVIPVLLSVMIMLAGLLTPAGPVILIISSVFASIFLAWDNTDLVPARRMLPFNKRFQLLRQHMMFHIGFGICFLIPWVNILLLSFAPIGATRYYLEKNDL